MQNSVNKRKVKIAPSSFRFPNFFFLWKTFDLAVALFYRISVNISEPNRTGLLQSIDKK